MNGPGGAVGIGTDLVDVARIASMRERHGDSFLNRVFCDFELEACLGRASADMRLAARFAAKEAVVKALGTGFSGDITMRSVGVRNLESGAPEAVLDAAASARLREIGGTRVLISLSHLKSYAQAVAIAVK